MSSALIQAYDVQESLIRRETIGEFVDPKITSGKDKSLEGDWYSEEAVLNWYRQNTNLPIIFYSEEHGVVETFSNPELLAVLDGWDGSSKLKVNSNADGGTMLAVAEALDPKYSDFVFGGATEHSRGLVVYAEKDWGLWKVEMQGHRETAVKISPIERKKFSHQTRIHVDDEQFYENYARGVTSGLDTIAGLVRKTFSGKLKKSGFENLTGKNSSSSMCLDLILGNVAAVCGVIAKGVFEPPAEYVMLREIGGVLIAGTESENEKRNWQLIDNEKWLEFGRPLTPLIRAANEEIGWKIVEEIER